MAIMVTGVMRIFSIICYFASAILFLCTPSCLGTPVWYTKLFPISAASNGVFIGTLYALTELGILRNSDYVKWNILQFIFDMLGFIFMLTISILTIVSCESSRYTIHRLSAPISIVGAFLLATSSTIWAVRTRSSKDVNLPKDEDQRAQIANHRRKSYVA